MKIGLLKTLQNGDKVPMRIIASVRFRLLWLFNNTSWLNVPILACLLLAGCGNTVSWDEEVKLRTGEVITIERTALHAKGGGEWAAGGQNSYPIKHFIRFRYPSKNGTLIEWQSQAKDISSALDVEFPLVLDLSDTNTWFIYTLRWENEHCIRYVTYQFEQGHWVEKPLTDQPIAIHDSNLYLSADKNSLHGVISLLEKNEDRGNHVWFFKQVGPKQIIGSHRILTCEWDSSTQQYIPRKIKEGKK
jgi:hypothetical protein